MELKTGRRLKRQEHVHHIDGNRMNNSPDNLEIIDGSEHNRAHTIKRNLKHDPDNFVCADCGNTENPHKAFGFCQNCWARRRRRARAVRPCKRCGCETLNHRIYASLCARCSAANWTHCRACGRIRDELPQGKTVINPEGLRRACNARLKRQLTK
ncbi:MAG: HNH endonuclease [Blastocatellia bacterium]